MGCAWPGVLFGVREKSFMSSKTHQKKMIRKHKQHAHKANRKADQKRMDRNRAILSRP